MNVPTLTQQSSIDGPSLAPINGPEETTPSATGSGTYVPTPRNVARVGHAPDVIGNGNTAGSPTNWVRSLASWSEVESSIVRKGRNKRGNTAIVTRHGRVVRDMIDHDRGAHVDALAGPDRVARMSADALARWATDYVRYACALCRAFWATCEHHEHDTESPDYADNCKRCIGRCGCMETLQGTADTLQYAEVVHAGEGATCDVAQHHGSIADGYNGVRASVLRAIRNQYVSSKRANSIESKLAWPIDHTWPTAPTWRKSETTREHTATVIYDRWNGDATVTDDATVTHLPSADCNGGRFQGFTHHAERGPLASRRGTKRATVAIQATEATAARLAPLAAQVTELAVGDCVAVKVGSATVTVTRNQEAKYTVARGKTVKRAKSLALALSAADKLGNRA